VDFTATEYFEVTQTAFGRTCWNDTHVGLLQQEVMDGYSLTQLEPQNYMETDLCFQIILCKLLDRMNRSSWLVQFLGYQI
jgi:hypothetical protein